MSNHQQNLEEIDRGLADIAVMGQVAMRSAQNLQKDDSGGYYRLAEQETSTLLFSVHDVLDRIEKLRANLVPNDAGTVDEGGMSTRPPLTPAVDEALNELLDLRQMTIVSIRVLDGNGAFRQSHEEQSDSLSFCLHDMLGRIDKLDGVVRRLPSP